MLPDGLPTGVHVVMLMTRRKHIEHADSWLGVRSACERLLMERQMALKGEMQMYLCCLLPRFWPLRWFWRYRMCSWARLLEEEEQTQVHILSCTKWSSFFQKMQIHNDGRAHTMVIRNDGEILWVGHDRFQEQFHEREMVNVVNEECQSREDAKLLEGGVTGAIEASEELTVAAGDGRVDAGQKGADRDWIRSLRAELAALARTVRADGRDAEQMETTEAPVCDSGLFLAVLVALPRSRAKLYTRRPELRSTVAAVAEVVEVAEDSTVEEEPWLQSYLKQANSKPPAEIRQLFLEAVRERGLELYDAQREAIEQIFDDVHVVLNTPTGSGKSLVAMAMLFRAVAEEARAYYTCPVKALVSEKFFALCRDFGSELIGMATGDVSINSQASIICCTAEVLANVALRGANHDLQYAVMDEFHFFADKGRGYAWEVPLFRLPQVTFLLMSATMGRNEALNANLERFTGREVSVVTSTERPVPLDWSYLFKNVREAIFELVADGRAPIYVVSFTQDAAATLAQSLITKELAPSEEQKHTLSEAMKSTDFDTPYGPSLRALLLNGIGLHHAGLIPKYRLLVEQMAQSGLLTCICGTDTLGVGVNVPIRSVLFTQLCKYNGESTALLSARDFHQIAGRAGRKGFDEAGSVVAVAPAHEVYNQKHAARRSPSKRPASGDVLEHLDPTSFVGRRRRLKSSLRAALLLWSRSSS
ncbi:unnamed protein product [Durusdinium trenchii]|uniref:RNA helicase n=1 Tax=Durusdinium trenchii TaxID=1381693 RepID=A0ABP0P3P3_9DINO